MIMRIYNVTKKCVYVTLFQLWLIQIVCVYIYSTYETDGQGYNRLPNKWAGQRKCAHSPQFIVY